MKKPRQLRFKLGQKLEFLRKHGKNFCNSDKISIFPIVCSGNVLFPVGLSNILPNSNNSSSVQCSGKTGVEMEALTAVAVALLTVYDMCKAVTKDMVITDVRLLRKSGGKSDYVRVGP